MNVPSDSNCESAIAPVATLDQWLFAVDVGAWAVEDLGRVTMVGNIVVRVGVGVIVRHD